MTPEQWQHFAGPMFTGFDMDRTMPVSYTHLSCISFGFYRCPPTSGPYVLHLIEY